MCSIKFKFIPVDEKPQKRKEINDIEVVSVKINPYRIKRKCSLNIISRGVLKGLIAESAVRNHIIEKTLDEIKKERWDMVYYNDHPLFLDIDFFNEKYLHPDEDLIDQSKKLSKLLTNAPDGFIYKLNKTNKSILFKEAYAKRPFIQVKRKRLKLFGKDLEEIKMEENKHLSIVSGNIETVEIKADKAKLHSHQRKMYKNSIEKGFPLRYYNVKIISFDNNLFSVTEYLITKPEDLVGL